MTDEHKPDGSEETAAEPQASNSNAAPVSAIPNEELARLTDDIVAALKTVYDPEIPADVYELGLIYKVDIEDDRTVKIDMTLTAPGCGMGDVLVQDAREKIAVIPTVSDVTVELVFDPPWNVGMMSEEARLQTGMM